jgi:hypothetical protein
MRRAFAEGDGVTVSTNLLAWMVERYRTLVGIPLDEPLNGQLIPQSPDEYPNLLENDYLEALGIERLYSALVNADESPGHLIHLAHALGRAAKETSILSDSKPNTTSLNPLPPTKLPRIRTPQRNIRSTGINVGSITGISESDSSTESTDTDEPDQCASDNACTADEVAYVTDDHDGSSSSNVFHAIEDPETFVVEDYKDRMIVDSDIIANIGVETSVTSADKDGMDIHVEDIPEDVMDTEELASRHSDDDYEHSREVTDGEGKRKRVDSLALSPQVVRSLSFDEAVINLNHNFYKVDDERGATKRSKLLNSPLDILDTANDQPLGRLSVVANDGNSTVGMWSMPRRLLLAGTSPVETAEEISTAMKDQEEAPADQHNFQEIPVIQAPCEAPTTEKHVEEVGIYDPAPESISAATKV